LLIYCSHVHNVINSLTFVSLDLILSNSIQKLNETRWDQDKGSFVVNKLFDGILSLCQRYPENLELLNSFLQFFMKMTVFIEQCHEGLQDECSPACHHFITLTKTYKLFESIIQKIGKSDPRSERIVGLTVTENIYKLVESGLPAASRLLYKFSLLPCLINLPEKHVKSFYLNHIFDVVTAAVRLIICDWMNSVFPLTSFNHYFLKLL